MQRTAVLRADASAGVGLGHVVRSLTLGTALVGYGWNVVLVTARLPDGIAARAQASSIHVHPLVGRPHGADDAAAVLSVRPDLVIADGYHFESSFYEPFVEAGPLFCVIDDNGENVHGSARVVVNQNPSATEQLYDSLSADRALLLGLRYALVRNEVTEVRINDTIPRRTGVFVSMGGIDPLGLSEQLVTVLSRSGIPTRLSIGPTMGNRDGVLDRVRRLPGVSVVTDHDFVTALNSAAVAVIGAGTTMWEAAFLGVPSISIIVADNQAGPASSADDRGFTVAVDARTGASPDIIEHATRELLADVARRDRMTRLGRTEVDGRGAIRVAAFLSEFSVGEGKAQC